MLKSIKLGIGTTLLVAAQLSTAGIAEIQVSNVTLSVSGGWWWYWVPSEVNWVPITAGASAELLNPTVSDGATAWHGNAVAATVSEGSSTAEATLNAGLAPPPGEPRGLNGVSASAKVVANDGQSGWAFTNVFEGQILVANSATLTLSATIDAIAASGSSAQANAYIEVCSLDADVCDFANSAEAFVDGTSGPYSGPSTLSASWTNPNPDVTGSAWARVRFGLTAAADTDVQAVPEPASWALALTALAGLGALRKRRRTA